VFCLVILRIEGCEGKFCILLWGYSFLWCLLAQCCLTFIFCIVTRVNWRGLRKRIPRSVNLRPSCAPAGYKSAFLLLALCCGLSYSGRPFCSSTNLHVVSLWLWKQNADYIFGNVKHIRYIVSVIPHSWYNILVDCHYSIWILSMSCCVDYPAII
jgi:hypothetical protein